MNTTKLSMTFLFAAVLAAPVSAGEGITQSSEGASRNKSQAELGREIVSEAQAKQSQQGSSKPTEGAAQQRFDQQMSQQGNAMGVPEPGSVSDMESTDKQRKPAKDWTPDKKAQVTLGGSRSFIDGEVLRIEGERYFIRDLESGEEVRLIVNKDTNLDCGSAPESGGTMSTERDQRAIEQNAQSQERRSNETASGSGFKIGDCSFNKGDRVKAEVSDQGTVTTLKYISEEQGSHGAAVRSPSSGGPGEMSERSSDEQPTEGQNSPMGR